MGALPSWFDRLTMRAFGVAEGGMAFAGGVDAALMVRQAHCEGFWCGGGRHQGGRRGVDIALMVSLSNHEGGAISGFPENA